ncbi:MAG: methyltransferase domain-containing protein, partial [Sedimentisphaerales bacterium]|nr:methyltransferase domain-containing protein [Sedimentisphaerales bacterium]
GWVLEHLPDPRAALAELVRVLRPSGRVLLMAYEDNMFGALVGLFWRCRTYSREELRLICDQVGLTWHREIWLTRIHKWLHLGGIFVEAVKRNGCP